jgi:nucleotide-binding universal stress UspA family protein
MTELGRLAGRSAGSGAAGAGNAVEQPNRIKQILLPTDFSACSRHALDEAVALAQECGARITLLYVVDLNLHTPPTGPANAEQLKAELWAEGVGQLGQEVVGLLGKQVEVQTLIREGLPRDEILQAAEGHDLIVIGRRRKSFWKWFSRHTVEGVLEAAPCPVLVVRADEEGVNL